MGVAAQTSRTATHLRDRMVSTRAILITKTKTRTTMIAIRLLKLKLEPEYSKKPKTI